MREGGLMDESTDDAMSDQEGVPRWDDPAGLQRAQRTGREPLMGIDFVKGEFHFPSFMIQAHQVERHREQAVVLSMTGPGWDIDFILTAAPQPVLAPLAPLVVAGIDVAQL